MVDENTVLQLQSLSRLVVREMGKHDWTIYMYITKSLFFNTQNVASVGILAPRSGNNIGHPSQKLLI